LKDGSKVRKKRLCSEQVLVFGPGMHGFVRQFVGISEVEAG
jgi:hypothetical protein